MPVRADRVEGTATQRHELIGAGEQAIKVEAKLSTGDLLGALREIYGLNQPAARPADAVSVPAKVGGRSEPQRDREEK